ncbi:MAG: ELM1/GtrOC1 family putative glycosyltransferase [Candidatus Omnitrophota bacterium]
MKKNSVKGCLINILLNFALFCGRRLGDLLYLFDVRHKSIAYSNIKRALGASLNPSQILKTTREFYRAFGQNIMEIFFIPAVDKDYIEKYISIEGLDYIQEAFKNNKGVILLGVHEGSWELSNIICANLGFPFVLFVRERALLPFLDKFLNSYRSKKGCRVIQRKDGVRQLILALKRNEAVGMTLDQGGRNGVSVDFFGKDASFAQGAVKLALRHGAVILPAFYTRIRGPYIKVIVEPAFKMERTPDPKEDIESNLRRLALVFEKLIRKYPQEYLWTYKIWKYSKRKDILILDDAKAGHLRQSQAAAKIAFDYLKGRGINSAVHEVKIKFQNALARKIFMMASALSGKYNCQGCLQCLRVFLAADTYESLIRFRPDIIISGGAALAAVNYLISRQNLAKSIVIMKPSFLSIRRFDLVIMPLHDKPPRAGNVVVTTAALNLIDEAYLREQAEELTKPQSHPASPAGGKVTKSQEYIGLLMGGNSKGFALEEKAVSMVLKNMKAASEKLDMGLLVTTSRRTPQNVEKMIKQELEGFMRCRLLVIANEKNIPQAVGGILGLSRIIIVSPESISMISEAVSSRKYVLVFKSNGLSPKHRAFLGYLDKNKYIHLSDGALLAEKIEELCKSRPQVPILEDNLKVRQALERIL